LLLMHSLPALQPEPFAFFARHDLVGVSQNAVVAHAASLAQPVAHAPAEQSTYGLHAVRVPCGASPFRGEQIPLRPATSHAWHCPVHAVSQQYPSTQFPVGHVVPVVHETASGQ